MRLTDEEDERLRLIRRYVTPDRRYLKVGGVLLGMSGRDRAKFRWLTVAVIGFAVRVVGVWREDGIGSGGVVGSRLSSRDTGCPTCVTVTGGFFAM